MIKIGIVGASGYTGSELVRLLVRHPEVEISVVTSETHAGKPFSEIHPFFKSIFDQPLQSINDLDNHNPDLVFLALPHGVSMDFVKDHAEASYRIIDLSGDFRLSAPEVYKQWYGKEHVFPKGFESAVYGIPELNREKIRTAELIANPGCYPTGAILAIYPLVSAGLASDEVIVDSKSGVTGAGIKPKPVTHFATVNEDFQAYGVKTHRHTIEIEEQARMGDSGNTVIQFTPHLIPVNRGIISTAYLSPLDTITEDQVRAEFEKYYAGEPFVRLVDSPPAIKQVRGTNYCDIFLTFDERTGRIIVISAIDNLVRGAAGQAVQNMNIAFGFEETAGLFQIPLNP